MGEALAGCGCIVLLFILAAFAFGFGQALGVLLATGLT